ncbi:MAG: NYN domain-containing protein [Candidatus Eremiobacteraeota bacterium]|nr:NYN domain-containing protein [Candidatus Eremiobacteraeota bacterium]
MLRFALFVDGSNLSGSLTAMNLNIDDYEQFYGAIFKQGLADFEKVTFAIPPVSGILTRVYWYRVGSIDEWDLDQQQAVDALYDRFVNDRELRDQYLQLVGPTNPGLQHQELLKRAWDLCFEKGKAWYNKRRETLLGYRKFSHSVRRSTDLIDIVECGHWKVDILHNEVTEKQLDTSLAVDMLAFEHSYDVAVVISGDADSIPSIKYMKERGKTVAAVEFLSGFPPEQRGRGFSSQLKLAADYVIRIYQMNLVRDGLGKLRTTKV